MIGDAEIDTVEGLINAMAAAISPYAFSEDGCEIQRDFSRAAAARAMRVCAPVVLDEAARMVWSPDEGSLRSVSIIKSLRKLFY
jgi:hypothetical protein